MTICGATEVFMPPHFQKCSRAQKVTNAKICAHAQNATNAQIMRHNPCSSTTNAPICSNATKCNVQVPMHATNVQICSNVMLTCGKCSKLPSCVHTKMPRLGQSNHNHNHNHPHPHQPLGWYGRTKKKKAKLEMQFLCIDQTTPRIVATSINSSEHVEVPQLVELTQKLCVLEDFVVTQPIHRLVW